MPSVSKAQQRFMGLVHAYKKGEVPASQVSKAVKDAAKSMKKKSTKKFAGTKHKGLPNKVRSENMNEDGHTDVASIERKLKLIMQDAMDTLNALRGLSNEDSLPSWWTDKITLAKDYVGKSRDYIMNPAESVNERISVSDERHFGKKGIIIMIDDNGKKVSAIFKDKKNAKEFNRNKPADIKKLLQLAKKTKYPKAIDEYVNENPQKVAKLLIKYGNNTKDVKDMIKKHYKKAKKDRSKSTPSELANYISFLSANESVNEDITSSGYSQLKKIAYGISVGLKDLSKGIRNQNDDMVLPEIEYIYDKAIEMKKMLKNKRFNESVNEAERKMSSLEMQQIILLAKAMREMPGSPAQKKIKKQINVIRKKLGQAPVKESVNEVSGVDVAKKVLKNKQHEKGIDLQTANLIVTIDKAYDKNPRLQKKFRALQLPKMKQLILKYYG